MKKVIIYSVLAVLSLVSLRANAAMYILGFNGDWTAGHQEMMTEVSSGVYAITHNITTDIYFIFMDTDANTWDAINAGHRFGAGTGSDYNLTIGKASPVVNDATANGSYHFKGDGSDYTVTYDTNAGTVLVSDGKTTPAAPKFYVFKADGVSPWNLCDGTLMTAANADSTLFTLKNLYVESAASDGYGFVMLASQPASATDAWDEFNANRYAAKGCKGDFVVSSSFIDQSYITLEPYTATSGAFKMLSGYYNLTVDTSNDDYRLSFSTGIAPVLGDVTGNGVVDVSDVTALINKILGLEDLDNSVCDINGDEKVDVSDITALINIILGVEENVKTVTSTLTIDITSDKSCYKPGETVKFSINTKPNSAYIRYRTLTDVISEEPLTATSWTWTPPTTDFTGYMVDIYQKTNSTTENILGTIAVDVSSDWKMFPRYGFVATFGSDKMPDVTQSEMKQLARCHINGVQFQDWHWKHHWPLGGTRTAPLSTYTDIANRTVYASAIKNYIDAQHELGMNSIFYNLCFGALDEDGAASDGVQPSWYLFTDNNHGSKDYHPLLEIGWKSNIYLVNPGNTEWQAYLAQRNDDVYANFDFDGYQIDQLGYRGTRYDYNGNSVDLTQGYASFINAMKNAHPEKRLVMNAVSNYGSQNILGTGNVDFAYNELWSGEDQFSHLRSVILENNQFSGNKAKTVFAAYMNYGVGSGYFNNAGILLTDAVMFSLGGSHLELGGDHMLCNEYFPNSNLTMNSDLQKAIVRYYDFQTAYENLLMGDGYEITPTVTCSDQSIKGWSNSQLPEVGNIMTYSKKVGNRLIVHLLNFVNANSTSWRDYDGTMPQPKNFFNLTLTITTSSTVRKVWVASPDQHGGVAQQLKFSQVGNKVTITVPKLQYWDMLVLE